jgi:hypothetical protein
MSAAGQILSMFTNDELKLVHNSLLKLPDRKNLGDFHAYTNGFQQTDYIYPMIRKLILEKLEKVLDKKLNLTHGMLLKEEIPWTIHTDYNKGDSDPGLAILLPLNTEEVNTHTVVFNEESTTTFNDFVLNNNKLETNAKDLYNNLCSHEDIDNLEYVSLLGAFKWIPGSVIYWDRKLLHCSDNFLQQGIKIKTGLVIFTHD